MIMVNVMVECTITVLVNLSVDVTRKKRVGIKKAKLMMYGSTHYYRAKSKECPPSKKK